MKVTIITVCYNRADTIEDTIKSVLSQDYTDIEYIIIDGGSNDGTLEIIEKYRSQIHKFISEKDEGFYDGLNKGIAMATGEIVGQLNSDDFYTDEKVISKVVQTFVNGSTDCVYADLVFVDSLDTKKVVRYWKSGSFEDGSFRKGWMPCHPTFFLKRHYFQKYGSYNTSLKFSADYELMLRMLHKNGIKAGYLPETIINMRTGGLSNMSLANRVKANLEDRKAWKLNGLKPGSFTLWLKPVSKLRQLIMRPARLL